MMKQRLVIGMTGASGAIYGIRLLQVMTSFTGIETHLVMSKSAERTIFEETDFRPSDVKDMADRYYPVADIGAAIASGSFKCMGMVITPCSIRTLASVAYCLSDNLVSRAADVMLKERRKLVLLVRETPLHLGHLRAMTAACEAGATIMPPVPAFYHKPCTVDDLVDHTVGRVLDAVGFDHELIRRWGETESGQNSPEAKAAVVPIAGK
jgi:4-hydroxy-3-polyprenylbenzoate decarboxylase